MTLPVIASSVRTPVAQLPVELVERKGLGHPDTICDAVMEAVSLALSREYRARCGHILHHNVDKALLVAGESEPGFGGGRIMVPMRLIVGDRAASRWNGQTIPVWDIAEATVKDWFRQHLRFVDPDRHVALQNELHPGSTELTDIFARKQLTANDTSAGVGYAPLTETERLVLVAERYLNSPEFKARFPIAGEDIKVMGVRQGRRLSLTVAIAFVDRFVTGAASYFQQKELIQQDLTGFIQRQLVELDCAEIALNALDDPQRGAGGMYLTVLGTSAEGADGGVVGRGNRVNGLISFNRPQSLEAAAGKNPVSHVGKIYNVFSHYLAARIHQTCPGLNEVNVWMCSRIGCTLDAPWSLSVDLSLKPDAVMSDVEQPVRDLIQRELSQINEFTERLVRGEFPVC